MLDPLCLSVLLSFAGLGAGLRYNPDFVGYNLNENQQAVDPLDYGGAWGNHTYHPSPENWRFPFYSLFIDKFVNGDPLNDDINGTVFEHDAMQTQLRHGGDVQGLIDSLDYIQGMGVKALYIAGSPFINQPWGADAYSPLDLTLLDLHFGNIDLWRDMITQIHSRGMYVVLDNTFATMGDLIAFDGYENTSTPFTLDEHEVSWRNPNRQYLDFHFGNEYNETCDYPRFWFEDGFLIGDDVKSQMKGCYNSEFDQYGDTEAFGVFPDWRRQLSKFASAQDRLRDWVPSVRTKIEHFSCMTIQQLDIDGFRLDKALQITVDALSDWSHAMRECARSVGKENFFIPGEITGGNTLGSIYVGRGRQPDMLPENLTAAVELSSNGNSSLFIRDNDFSGLDAGAFHYSVYRALTRFLGMDGSLSAGYDTPIDWVDSWNQMLMTNDFVNANTGKFDPRHMYGVSNQDVFRWPAIQNGTDKWLLGNYITTLLLPGIPLLLWGEEQGFYVLDNTAENYVFGRQAMSSALAWEIHGCYRVGSAQYYGWDDIVEAASTGCQDPWNSLDHRDPSHPLRNIIKSQYKMRQNYPVLNDGMFLQELSKQTRFITLPGSSGVPTELGMWSTYRGQFSPVQDLSNAGGQGNQSIWLVYSNENQTTNFQFNCSGNSTQALIAPFAAGTTVKNLLFPFDESILSNSSTKLGLEGSVDFNGCLTSLEISAWGHKAYVPKNSWIGPSPMITKFLPGHDFRIISGVAVDEPEDVYIEIHFSSTMNCTDVQSKISFESSTENKQTAQLKNGTVACEAVDRTILTTWTGSIPTAWIFKANLTNVYNGVHSVTIDNVTNVSGDFTNARDTFLFRTGQMDNPVVFPRHANFTTGLLQQHIDGTFYISHKAAGATSWRASLDWGSSYSRWQPYTGGDSNLTSPDWTGTTAQAWNGHHVQVQYHDVISGSSDYVQHSELDPNQTPRRFPHLWAQGPFNQYGYDAGVGNEFKLTLSGSWRFDFMTEWPAVFQISEWGMNPDKKPDQTGLFGDIDGDSILDRMPPSSLANTVINITTVPPAPYLGWAIIVNDATLKFDVMPMGSQTIQITMYIILWLVPVITAVLAVYTYKFSFYEVKFNVIGVDYKLRSWTSRVSTFLQKDSKDKAVEEVVEKDEPTEPNALVNSGAVMTQKSDVSVRRSVLIATIEYDIEDWEIKIKIGGLGVMAQLMGKALGFQNLIWVVPCVGGIEYPRDEPAESMFVQILGNEYEVEVQYHQLRNITYVLLDAPIFRAQTKSEPYPPRMDDLDSAIYYSTWNQCIAEALRRFTVDLYHVNDYHGAAAPLYLLPKQTMPVCLSLHNAEFQGLWPLRNEKEFKEVCQVFNLPEELVRKYVQFGDVFNLLHAGASYLRVHQKGFGSVGVSKKYGSRAHARYPIFWGLDKIGQLPNPDPTDIAELDNKLIKSTKVVVDEEFEKARPELKRQAQEWAGLKQDPDAELFVFVGRWSMQKGVDLIADVFPQILEDDIHVQLITIGPVIDLYGKFAALKLSKLMEKYPGRVFSKPEFTALPPFIFSGAEFALIPSRDEPFGLVAVEFGRKGALGVGSRVGGLGQMPGWWFTVESPSTSHMLHQFKKAIKSALASGHEMRRDMRATSAKQRFPVAEWVNSLTKLQSTAMEAHYKENPETCSPAWTASTAALQFRSSNYFRIARPGFSTPKRSWSRPSTPVKLTSQSQSSTVSLATIVGGKKDFELQQVNPDFTDSKSTYYDSFSISLDKLTGDNSTTSLCIEDFLIKSEREWHGLFKSAKLGLYTPSMAISVDEVSPKDTRTIVTSSRGSISAGNSVRKSDSSHSDLWGLRTSFKPPSGFKLMMQRKVGDWPIYSFFMAFGQIIAASSYQITLLSGTVGQTPERLYTISSIYLATSVCWWLMYRTLKSVYVLSFPFLFYGLAFLLLGLAPFANSIDGRGWMQNVATASYAIASSAGSIFFALNFGDEGGAPLRIWIFRSCLIQGSQQIYVCVLWAWGSYLTKTASSSSTPSVVDTTSPILAAITIPIACGLFFVALLMFTSLPPYYHQKPGNIPSFYTSILRRKLALWFFVVVIIQNYFLGTMTGRNWAYLWSSNHAEVWQIVLLALLFFVVVWAAILRGFVSLSMSHSWILPVFAIGLGAPRWAQILWSCSNIGAYVPWAGSALGSALVGRSVWLWLGVLDALQGVGFGMILLQTLTRVHIAYTLITAQVLGSIATIAARASAPNAIGPGPLFPDFSIGVYPGASQPWFWVGLLLQMSVCVGFFLFFRKDQLNKP